MDVTRRSHGKAPASRRHRSRAVAALAFALALVAPAAAQAQTTDYWKSTPDRQDTVYALIYNQSPQTIPTGYDPVREAEEILRTRQQNLPPSNPKSPGIWKSIRTISVRSALSTPLRRIGTVVLAEATFGLGWKIGSGINAKFLKIGIPPEAPIVAQTNEKMTFRQAGSTAPLWYTAPLPEDGWYWSHNAGSNYSRQHTTEYLTNAGTRCYSATPPADFTVYQLPMTSTSCAQTPGSGRAVAYIAENDLDAPGPIEPYTNQPYDRSYAAPPAPQQSAVEQAIETELDLPENMDFVQWLNYELGSPGETDPLGVGDPNPNIAFPKRQEKFEIHKDDFASPYTDPHEYWEDAAEIVNRPNVEHCQRSDGATIYWDPVKQAIVIVQDGEIQTYFPPDSGYDYYDEQCAS